MSWKSRKDNGRHFIDQGRGITLDTFRKLHGSDQGRRTLAKDSGTKMLSIPKDKGVAFKNGRVYIKNGKVSIWAMNDGIAMIYLVKEKVPEVIFEGNIIKDGEIGIAEKFAMIRRTDNFGGNYLETSRRFTGLPKLKDSEYNRVL